VLLVVMLMPWPVVALLLLVLLDEVEVEVR